LINTDYFSLRQFLTATQSSNNAEKWDISIGKIIETVKNSTHLPCHSNGQEERDYWLGRLFGLQSIVQSKILFVSPETLEKYSDVLDLLFEVAFTKPWLMESSAWTISSSMSQWPKEIAEKAAEMTYKKLADSGLAKTGEGVGIWLALQAHQPSVVPPSEVWPKGSPLIIGNLIPLAKLLKESGSKEGGGENIKSKGSWNPKLGFVWDTILDAYFSTEKIWKRMREKKKLVAEWAEFWKVVIDGKFLFVVCPIHVIPIPQPFCRCST
jgi:DNA polymerase phi